MGWFIVWSHGIIPLYILLTLILFALLFRFATQLFIPTRTTRIEKISFFINFIAIYLISFFILPMYIWDIKIEEKKENIELKEKKELVLLYKKEIADFMANPNRDRLQSCSVNRVAVRGGVVYSFNEKWEIESTNWKILLVFHVLYNHPRSTGGMSLWVYAVSPDSLGFDYIDLFEKKFRGDMDYVFRESGSLEELTAYSPPLNWLCFIPRTRSPLSSNFVNSHFSEIIIFAIKEDDKETLLPEYLKNHFLCDERKKLGNSENFCK